MSNSKHLDRVAVQQAVDQRLARWLEAASMAAEAIDASYKELIKQTASVILRPGGGKRMRPYLLMLAYAGYGGHEVESALDIAAAQELYHHFLLLHDDIIDRDTVRYGAPNVIGIYQDHLAKHASDDRNHYANATALLAGDMLYSVAFERMLVADILPERKQAILHRMTRSAFEVIGGELADTNMPLYGQPLSMKRIRRTMYFKTSSYSFVTPLQLGGLLAGVSASELGLLERVAGPLGVAYQLADDLLDVWGESNVIGKPIMSDIGEGKHTVLVAVAFERLDAAGQARLRTYWGSETIAAADYPVIRTLLESCGARAEVERLITEEVTAASQALMQLSLNEVARQYINELIASSSNRTR